MQSPEELLAEQWSDPRWRVCNLYTIITDDGKQIRFEPNEEQLAFFDNIHNRNLILKARQLGFTTFAAIVALDQCLFVDNFTAGIIAHTLPDAKKIFRNKIKRVYDALPVAIRDMCQIKSATTDELLFENGSSISVSTSFRGGTLQLLHVSEMGKIARKHPAKAAEIVSGAFESVALDSIIIVESTAEGQEGWFYSACMEGIRRQEQGAVDTQMDYRLHFFPWYTKQSYSIPHAGVIIPDKSRAYFKELEVKEGIKLTPGQKAWYVKKAQVQGDNMLREYPATPQEAFKAAVDGTIYSLQMAQLRRLGRIGTVPFKRRIVVNTFWDFGVDDSTTVWLHQRVGSMNRFIKYFEANNEGLSFFWNELCDWADEQDGGVEWGIHYIPHDGNTRIQMAEITTKKQIMQDLGFRNLKTVPRVRDLMDGIEATRQILPECEFDEVGCERGIKALDLYSREWDADNGVWSRRPRHDEWSHGADGFRQFAQAYKPDAQADTSGDVPTEQFHAYQGGY